MIGREQAGAFGDDAVPVVIGIAGKGHVEFVFESDQTSHRVRRRRIHPDLAVPIDGHETEGGIDGLVDHGQIEVIPIGDGVPVVNARATQRVDAEFNAGGADRLHVEHILQIGDIRVEVVVPMRRRSAQRAFQRHAFHAGQSAD